MHKKEEIYGLIYEIGLVSFFIAIVYLTLILFME